MKNLLRSVQGEITSNEPLVIVLPDNVEQDITFKFYLRNDPDKHDSYTSFSVVSPTEAEISIYNAPEAKQTSVVEDIPAGTYKKEYKLYVNYVLLSKTSNSGTITINFYIEKEEV